MMETPSRQQSNVTCLDYSVAKDGQNLTVGIGQPTLKVGELTMGGT